MVQNRDNLPHYLIRKTYCSYVTSKAVIQLLRLLIELFEITELLISLNMDLLRLEHGCDLIIIAHIPLI